MKIALITPYPPFRGGISKHSENLYNELCKYNEVTVYNFSRLYPKILFPGTSQFLNNVDDSSYKSIRSIDSLIPKTWSYTSKNILEKEINCVIIRYWNPFFIPAYISIVNHLRKKNSNIKIYSICDNIISHEKFYFQKILIKSFLNKLNGVIIMSESVKKNLLSINGSINYKKILLPILSNLSKKISTNSAKQQLSYNIEKKIFLFFGLIREYKGLDILLSAINLINKNLVDKFECIIVGENYENLSKYKKIIHNDFKNNIKWVSEYIEDDKVGLYFSASDFVVLPYKKGSQSGIIPMAYHYSKPIIASNIEGLTEMVITNKTGYIFENKNVNELKNIMEKCINGQDKIDYNSINMFAKKLSIESYTKNIINFINE